MPIAGGQFKLGRHFPLFNTNFIRTNFSTQGLYYSPCFTVFPQCQHGTHPLQLRPPFLSMTLACFRGEGNERAWHCQGAELLRAVQPWGIKEIHVKYMPAVQLLCCRPEGADGQYVKCAVLGNSMCNTQVIFKLITRHNF